MKQYFNIIKIETSIDSGVGNRNKYWEHVDTGLLVPGHTFIVYGREMTIASIDDDNMVFDYRDRTFRINRHWQVLGTPEFDTSNERISKQARNVFFFSRDRDMDCEWSDGYAVDLVDQMINNNKDGNKNKHTTCKAGPYR